MLSWQYVIIGSNNCLAPYRSQAITSLNDDPRNWLIFIGLNLSMKTLDEIKCLPKFTFCSYRYKKFCIHWPYHVANLMKTSFNSDASNEMVQAGYQLIEAGRCASITKAIIGSENDMWPVWRQAITWINDDTKRITPQSVKMFPFK